MNYDSVVCVTSRVAAASFADVTDVDFIAEAGRNVSIATAGYGRRDADSDGEQSDSGGHGAASK